MANVFTAKAKEAKEKKELTPKQKKLKTIGNWIVNVLCVLIILFALFIAIMSITRSTSDSGIANIGGTAFLAVRTGSMEPTVKENDLILVKLYDGAGNDLKVGQVVTYRFSVDGFYELNTHRIVEIGQSGSKLFFRTKGDNASGVDTGVIYADDIVATWGSVDESGKPVNGGNWGQIGAAINWLQKDSLNFFLAIVLPLIILFIIYAFILIRTLVIAKVSKVQAETAAAAANANISTENLSDEEKKRLAEELLKSLNKDKSPSAETDGSNTAENFAAVNDGGVKDENPADGREGEKA